MIQVIPHMHIPLATEPVDFRKGIDGLAAVCKNTWSTRPNIYHLFYNLFKSLKVKTKKLLD